MLLFDLSSVLDSSFLIIKMYFSSVCKGPLPNMINIWTNETGILQWLLEGAWLSLVRPWWWVKRFYKPWVFPLLHSLRQLDKILLSQTANPHEYNYHNIMSRSLWSSVSGAGPQAVPWLPAAHSALLHHHLFSALETHSIIMKEHKMWSRFISYKQSVLWLSFIIQIC